MPPTGRRQGRRRQEEEEQVEKTEEEPGASKRGGRRTRARPVELEEDLRSEEEKRHDKLKALGVDNPGEYDGAAQEQLLKLLSGKAAATKDSSDTAITSQPPKKTASNLSSQSIDFLTISDNERDLKKKTPESENNSDNDDSHSKSGFVELDISSDTSEKNKGRIGLRGKASAKSPSKQSRKETRLRREEELTKEQHRISSRTAKGKGVVTYSKTRQRQELKTETDSSSVKDNKDERSNSDSDVQIVTEEAASPPSATKMRRLSRKSINTEQLLVDEHQVRKICTVTKSAFQQLEKKTAEVPKQPVKEGKKSGASNLKLRLLQFSSTDLESTFEDDSTKRAVSKALETSDSADKSSLFASVVPESPAVASQQAKKKQGSPQDKVVLLDESSDEETQDVSAAAAAESQGTAVGSQVDLFSPSPPTHKGPRSHSTPKTPHHVDDTVCNSTDEDTMQAEDQDQDKASRLVSVQETQPLSPDVMEEEEGEETQDVTANQKDEDSEIEVEIEDRPSQSSQGSGLLMKRKTKDDHRTSGPPCKKFELDWGSRHESSQPATPPTPITSPRKLINKVRLRRKLFDRNPLHVRPDNMDIKTYAKKLHAIFTKYDKQLRQAQDEVTTLIDYSWKSVKVGAHVPKTLDYMPPNIVVVVQKAESEVSEEARARLQKREAMGLRTRLQKPEDFLPDIGRFTRRALHSSTNIKVIRQVGQGDETVVKSKTKPFDFDDDDDDGDDFQAIHPKKSTTNKDKSAPSNENNEEVDAKIIDVRKRGSATKSSVKPVVKGRTKLASKEQKIFTGQQENTEFDDYFHEHNRRDSKDGKSPEIGQTGSSKHPEIRLFEDVTMDEVPEKEKPRRQNRRKLPVDALEEIQPLQKATRKRTRIKEVEKASEDEVEEDKPGNNKRQKGVAPRSAVSPTAKTEEEKGQCPMCYAHFTMARLQVHAAICAGKSVSVLHGIPAQETGRVQGERRTSRENKVAVVADVHRDASLLGRRPIGSQEQDDEEEMPERKDLSHEESGDEWQPKTEDKALQVTDDDDDDDDDMTEGEDEATTKAAVKIRGRGRGRGRARGSGRGRGGVTGEQQERTANYKIDNYYVLQKQEKQLEQQHRQQEKHCTPVKTSAASTAHSGTPSTPLARTPSAGNSRTPSTGNSRTPLTTRTRNPSTSSERTPSTSGTHTPSKPFERTPSTGSQRIHPPSSERTPSTSRTHTPSTSHPRTPSTPTPPRAPIHPPVAVEKEACQECIICQRQVPVRGYEQHVMECVDNEEMKNEQAKLDKELEEERPALVRQTRGRTVTQPVTTDTSATAAAANLRDYKIPLKSRIQSATAAANVRGGVSGQTVHRRTVVVVDEDFTDDDEEEEEDKKDTATQERTGGLLHTLTSGVKNFLSPASSSSSKQK